jgi:type IV secretion system protein VirD4
MTLSLKNPLWLKAVLVVAVLATLAGIWMYLAGAIYLELVGLKYQDAQLATLYRYWYYYDHMPAIHTKLMTAAGIAAVVVLVPVALLLKPRKKSLHGEARFANTREMKKAGLFGTNGIIVGKWGKRFVMCAASLHALVKARTRGGKGIAVVIPNCLNWRDSLVVNDPKQEAYDLTSGYRYMYGQECYLFNPVARDYKTHRWNPLGYISDDPNFRIDDIQKIAAFIFPDIEGQDPIWTSSGRSLMLGTVLYLIETPGLPVTFGALLRTVTQQEEAGVFFKRIIQERIDEGNPLSQVCMSALNDFVSTSEATRTSIRKTFSARFELFNNPLVDAATAANDFDFRDLRKKRMSIYIGISPGDLDRLSPLLNLFWQQLTDINTMERPEQNPALKHEVLLLPDEFTAMGKIKAISKGVAYLAGYGLRLLPIIQGMAQLREVYGDDAAETFGINLGLQIEFAPAQHDNDTAEEISKALGDQTWRVKTSGKSFGKNTTRSENNSDQRRPLMLPQEVKAIGMWKQFIFMPDVPPIFCDKVAYFKEPIFIDRLKEVSPVLRALGKELPTKKQLDDVAASGALRAPVPTIAITPVEYKFSQVKPADTEAANERNLKPSDVNAIAELKESDFSCDFSDIEVPAEQPNDAELQAGVDKLLERFGMAA